MSEKETGGQAFPLGANEYGGHGSQGGMTLLDYFAAKADISIYSPVDNLYRRFARNPTVQELADYIAEVRFIEANAMLKERAK